MAGGGVSFSGSEGERGVVSMACEQPCEGNNGIVLGPMETPVAAGIFESHYAFASEFVWPGTCLACGFIHAVKVYEQFVVGSVFKGLLHKVDHLFAFGVEEIDLDARNAGFYAFIKELASGFSVSYWRKLVAVDFFPDERFYSEFFCVRGMFFHELPAVF